MSKPDDVRFRINPAAAGWSWTTFGSDRRPFAQGVAPNRNAAAACVIRALALTALGAPAYASDTPSRAA